MILVLPFCEKDGELAIENLKWIQELDSKLPYTCLLSHDNETPARFVRDMEIISKQVFSNVITSWYQAPDKKHWPAAANWAFQSAARYIAHFFPKDSWLFLESDATPIKSGWLQQLEAEHIKGGLPFSGHVVDGMGHPNGVAIYPPMVAQYSQDAMRVEETAWDVVLGHTVDGNLIHHANNIIRHCWNMDPVTGECTNGHGISPTFTSIHDVVAKVDLNASIYHRVKDGSLIKWLREFYKAPHLAMVPDHTGYADTHITTTVGQSSGKDSGASGNAEAEQVSIVAGTGGTSTSQTKGLGKEIGGAVEGGQITNNAGEKTVESNEKEHTEVDSGKTVLAVGDVVAGTDSGKQSAIGPPSPNEVPISKTEIFIVTYWKDFPWLEWCLKCLRRHATQFAGITIALPNKDIPKWNFESSARVVGYDEVEGKGMVQHMAVKCMADDYVPSDTKCVLHMDPDVMTREAVTPRNYFYGDNPYYVIRSYDSLTDAKSKVVSDCYQWRAVAEKTLAMPIKMYTMCRHPTGFPIGFYKRFRRYVESKQNKPFPKYVLEQRNEFPQTFAEFPTMGAFAFKHMHDHFKWIDVSEGNHLAPKEQMLAYWSHEWKNRNAKTATPEDPNWLLPDRAAEIEKYLK